VDGSRTIERKAIAQQTSESAPVKDHTLSWVLIVFCLFILFANLGGAALFEPDEGRNAEKAREILVLGDWVTPHENFVPVLDKPMFFYWLIAFSYKLFGVSEWSARFPSALAALGCLCLVYRFSRAYWGAWDALWSTLILLTSIEFYLLARIVILDMTLAFFITLALCSFYAALHTERDRARSLHCLLMYLALGGATLVKGLIGVVAPGTVMIVYLLVTRRWSALGKLYLFPGALLFLAIVAPWYLWAEARNPGYLEYYFWDEHFNRFMTGGFKREKNWSYLFFAFLIGFMPWTALAPLVVKDLWRKLDDRNLFLVIWALVPFAFFLASRSKLPHYLLPIFPAIALLTAQTVAATFQRAESKRWSLFLVWLAVAGFVVYLALGGVWPDLLPPRIRSAVAQNSMLIWISAALLIFIHAAFAFSSRVARWPEPRRVFICVGLTMSVSLFVAAQLQVAMSLNRSAKALAQATASFVNPGSQVVLYDTHAAGLLFYLRLERPAWVVIRKGQTKVMESPYVSKNLANLTSGYGKIFFSSEEFEAAWRQNSPSLRVFVETKHLNWFKERFGVKTKELARLGTYALVSRD